MTAEKRRLGRWSEEDASEIDRPSVYDFVLSGTSLADASLIAGYLDGAYCLAATGAAVLSDVLTGETVRGPMDIRTDGEWIWPQTLAHCVRSRNVTLTEEFVERIRALAYCAPRLTEGGGGDNDKVYGAVAFRLRSLERVTRLGSTAQELRA